MELMIDPRSSMYTLVMDLSTEPCPWLAHIITPRCTCAARGQVIALGGSIIVILQIIIIIIIILKPNKSLSEVHFTQKGIQWPPVPLAARQVFVAFANPVSMSFWQRINNQKHKRCQIQTTPYG